MIRKAFLAWMALLGIALLPGCELLGGPAATELNDGTRADVLGRLRLLTGLPALDDEKQQVCLANSYSMPGQGWKAGLTIGGVTRDLTARLDPEETELKSYKHTTFNNLFLPTPAGAPGGSGAAPGWLSEGLQGDVQLYLLDDFEHPAPIQEGPVTMYVTHGQLVKNHIISIALSTGNYKFDPQANTLISNVRTIQFKEIHLKPENLNIPLPDGTSRTVRLNRETPVANQVDNPDTSRHLVMNMSFAMIPCAVAADYEILKQQRLEQTGQLYRFGDYLTDLFAAQPADQRELVKQAVTTVSSKSELIVRMNAVLNAVRDAGNRAVAVASSGNYAQDRSMAPGSRPEVISVGGLSWNSLYTSRQSISQADKLFWSNNADLYSVGEWFHIPSNSQTTGDYLNRSCGGEVCFAPDGKNPGLNYDTFGYRGTSFAAPTAAAYFALRITNNACYAGPLGFSAYTNSSYTPLLKNSAAILKVNGGLFNKTC